LRLLRPSGSVILIEGRWSTGDGLSAAQCEQIVRGMRSDVTIRPLPERIYWGTEIEDERYLLVSAR
jgi:hypothetical protein